MRTTKSSFDSVIANAGLFLFVLYFIFTRSSSYMKITDKIIQQILLWTELEFKQARDYLMKLQIWQEQPSHDTLPQGRGFSINKSSAKLNLKCNSHMTLRSRYLLKLPVLINSPLRWTYIIQWLLNTSHRHTTLSIEEPITPTTPTNRQLPKGMSKRSNRGRK